MSAVGTVPEYPYPEPDVRIEDVRELDHDLLVVPNQGVQLVPNIGVVGGRDAVLVIDTGLGPANAERVLRFASDYAAGRRLYLTSTHFHPEHAFGAQVFAGAATYVVNRAQADDLAVKGHGYLAMFRGLGAPVARALADVELVTPDVGYEGDEYDLDLGGRVVRMRPTGRAHSKGDQVITVPDAGVMFTGDLVETGQFAIFPWFPPHDTDVSGIRWISVLDRLAAEQPSVVVPGHGDIDGPRLLSDVHDYLTLLRDETWRRRDSPTIVAEVTDVLVKRYPEWAGREWIAPGVGCLCAEHADDMT